MTKRHTSSRHTFALIETRMNFAKLRPEFRIISTHKTTTAAILRSLTMMLRHHMVLRSQEIAHLPMGVWVS